MQLDSRVYAFIKVSQVTFIASLWRTHSVMKCISGEVILPTGLQVSSARRYKWITWKYLLLMSAARYGFIESLQCSWQCEKLSSKESMARMRKP